MHDKNAWCRTVLAMLILAAVLASGCMAERRGEAPGAATPAIQAPDLPGPPPATVAVPGASSAPEPRPDPRTPR